MIPTLLIAIALFAAACGALVAEMFVLSFGLLSLISLALAVASIIVAFQAHAAAGWGFLAAAPVIAGFILRWGMGAMQRSRLVPKAEITADAGFHHEAERLGLAVGATGTMLTAARPTGRARFAGGDIDVQCNGSADTGDAITIQRIEGPAIFVALAHP